MKKLFFAIFFIVAYVSTMFAADYKVTLILPEEMEGGMAYILNYDTKEKIDSALIESTTVVFEGQIEKAIPARIAADGRVKTFILEEGDIVYNANDDTLKGGKLNALSNEFDNEILLLSKKFNEAQTDALRDDIRRQYEVLNEATMLANIDNPIGYWLFLEKAYDMLPSELETFIENNPSFQNYERVKALLEASRKKAATSEGAMFTDFEIEYDGVKHKLSDVVGKGDYVLVDFWASWCGPCIRQTAVLKDIYKEYKDDGLKILGVAVWDEPANTLKAIEQHELPWESWLNGQTIPTDAYGISGIPCIILFGPDGTILSRDKQSAELKQAVAEAMANREKGK